MRDPPPFPILSAAVCGAAVAAHAWGAVQPHGSYTAVAEQLRLLASGAKSAALIAEAGEPWRLLTSHFVHTSWTHVAFNVAFFFPVAAALEQVVRRDDFLAFLLLAATGSALSSLLWTPEVSAGASGLVFAALAAAVTFGIRHRATMSAAVQQHFGLWVLPFLLLILAVGAGNPYVDHASHFGGLVMGAALGLVLRARAPRELRAAEVGRSASVFAASAATVVALFLSPVAVTGGRANVAYALPGGAQVSVPPTWTPRFGPLGELQFRGASGLVVLTADVVSGPAAADSVNWYVEQRINPLISAGLVSGAEAGPAHRGRDARFEEMRVALERSGAPMVRDVYFLGHGLGPRYILSLEMPRAWTRKYAETRAQILGSFVVAPPGPSKTLRAAAIP